ncbi:hypothetical protein TWF730_006200 [Orbilia blumenaviensis]|uniref:Uncharacterized protein n=1 Tax=Orbilia blumenaviensis TaxID=1796055 RepID=A0AAV9TXJ4_9PEZI
MPEESLLLYARAYDLVEDHTSISPLSFICLPYDAEEEAVNPTDLISSLFETLQLRDKAYEFSNERLEVSRDVSSLLSRTISLRDVDSNEILQNEDAEFDSPYVDVPILRYESASLAKAQGTKFDLKKLPLKELVLDDTEDEGLEFPTWAWDRRNEIAEDYAGERMAVDRKVLEYLRKMVKEPTQGVRPEEREGNLDYLDCPSPKEITTPLSPLPTPLGFPLPDPLIEIAGQIEPLSLEPEDNLLPLINIESCGLGNDTLDEDPETGQLLLSIQQPPPPPLISSSPTRSLTTEFRIEEPLTPPFTSPSKQNLLSDDVDRAHSSSPSHRPTKRVRFSETVQEFIRPPSLDPSEDGDDNGEGFNTYDCLTESAMSEFTLGVMEPGAQFFLMQLQQEQLEDSMELESGVQESLRVKLPVMNWKRPRPPWCSSEDSNRPALAKVFDGEIMKKWEYRKSLDIAGLCWTISTTGSAPQSGVSETILPETEEELWERIQEVFPVLPLETIIEDEDESFWKDEPPEEELECAKIKPKTDLDSLIERKRSQISTRPRNRLVLLDPKSNLSLFLSHQSRILADTPIEPSLHSSSPSASPTIPPPSHSQTNPSTIQQPPTSTSPPPVPVPVNDPKSTFIISATFLTNRTLYKTIKSFCPTSKFIERGFEPFSSTHKIFGKQDQVPDEQTLEADIIVSPLVGVILTDLKTIRQRPLPNTNTASASSFPTSTVNSLPKPSDGIRDRISHLSGRYQTLIVGVSIDFGGGTDSGNGQVELGSTDCAILAAFIGFCEAIGDVEVSVIPTGGKAGVQELGKWVVEIMGLYSRQWKNVGLEVGVAEMESKWENFLRNSGMNSYAAQAVLTKLQQSGCGLVDFVTIEKESRRVIFEQFVGGKILERFEEVVGAGWQYY